MALDPSTLLSLDLGTDRVRSFAVGSTIAPAATALLEPGTGPRDGAIVGDRVLVLGELSGVMVVLERAASDGPLVVAASAPLPGRVEGDHAAGIAMRGEFVYVGMRGSDRIAVMRINADGEISSVGSVESGGRWPRHLVIDGDLLHVANQLSNTVMTFVIGADGLPLPVGSTDVPSPTYLLRA